jgi:hypothetical protein
MMSYFARTNNGVSDILAKQLKALRKEDRQIPCCHSMHSGLNDRKTHKQSHRVRVLHGFDSATNKDKPLYLKVGG